MSLVVTIVVDNSTESDGGELVTQSSPPMPENQLSLEDWDFQHCCFHNISDVPEPAGELQTIWGNFSNVNVNT